MVPNYSGPGHWHTSREACYSLRCVWQSGSATSLQPTREPPPRACLSQAVGFLNNRPQVGCHPAKCAFSTYNTVCVCLAGCLATDHILQGRSYKASIPRSVLGLGNIPGAKSPLSTTSTLEWFSRSRDGIPLHSLQLSPGLP